jgi:hypothetical protein
MYRVIRGAVFVLSLSAAFGQTTVDLRTQSKSVDFSSANATKPFKSGTQFPGICGVGDMFYKTDAPSGANLYGCTAPNAWTLEGQSLPAVFGNSGKVLSTDGTNIAWTLLSGDVSGSIGASTVIQLQGRPVSSTVPQAGQALAWNGVSSRWEPQTVLGAGGAGMVSQLGDLVVTRASATSLNIGANCSTATPCNVRFGSVVYSITAGATVSITSGTGSAYIYVTSSGVLTAGHNLAVSCNGCAAASGITSFPSDAVPLFSWPATGGTWNANGFDARAFLSLKNVATGTGLISVESAGKTTVSVDSTVVSLLTSVPLTSAAACTAGSWATDGLFYYLCINSGNWRRTALSTW